MVLPADVPVACPFKDRFTPHQHVSMALHAIHTAYFYRAMPVDWLAPHMHMRVNLLV